MLRFSEFCILLYEFQISNLRVCLLQIASVIRATWAMRATSWTRRTRAPRSIPSATVAAVPSTRCSGTGIPRTVPMNFFREGAEQDRPAEGAEFLEPVQERKVVLQGLAEADARIDEDPFPVHAGLHGDLDPVRQDRT